MLVYGKYECVVIPDSESIINGTLSATVVSVPIKDFIHHYPRALFYDIPRVGAYFYDIPGSGAL